MSAIPAGYKQTEVGVIPSEWELARVGDLGAVVRGGSPRPAGDPRYFNGTFIPWLTVAALTNISESQLRVSETVGFLTEEGSKHSRTLDRGTLIIANSGATLGVAKLLDITCCANDGIAAIINQRSGDKEFVCHYINTKTKHLREVVATGNGQPNLNTTLIREIPIPLPPENEQRAIAAALSDVDALLAKLDQLIAKKRDLKQAAMQQLLTGQTRLPGFSGVWEVKRLGDIAEIRDGTHQTPKYCESGIPFFSVENVTSGDFTNTKFISEAEHRFLTKSFKIEKGDILMTRIGSIGDCKLIDWDVDASFYVSLALLKIRRDQSAAFICHYSRSAAFQKEVELNSLQSAIPRKINLGPISDVRIEIPADPNEQTAIASVLSDMDTELAALEARRDKTRAFKQGMMQELLTGRIRLV